MFIGLPRSWFIVKGRSKEILQSPEPFWYLLEMGHSFTFMPGTTQNYCSMSTAISRGLKKSLHWRKRSLCVRDDLYWRHFNIRENTGNWRSHTACPSASRHWWCQEGSKGPAGRDKSLLHSLCWFFPQDPRKGTLSSPLAPCRASLAKRCFRAVTLGTGTVSVGGRRSRGY